MQTMPLLDPLLLRIVLPCAAMLESRARELAALSPGDGLTRHALRAGHHGRTSLNRLPGPPPTLKPLRPNS